MVFVPASALLVVVVVSHRVITSTKGCTLGAMEMANVATAALHLVLVSPKVATWSCQRLPPWPPPQLEDEMFVEGCSAGPVLRFWWPKAKLAKGILN